MIHVVEPRVCRRIEVKFVQILSAEKEIIEIVGDAASCDSEGFQMSTLRFAIATRDDHLDAEVREKAL